jgi:TetR/AcrR family transcriptional repressor of nem operon
MEYVDVKYHPDRDCATVMCYTNPMGHSKASKANTHARLVATAAARFKERGIDGISLADLMKELELTHGGFYKHFASRDELVTEALELALHESSQSVRDRLHAGNKPDVAAFVDFYLDESHRDARATGCAVAALGGDAPRKSAEVQGQFRKHIEGNLESLSAALPGVSGEEARAASILVLSALYGALIVARAVGDSALSREVLRTVRRQVLAMTAAKKPPARVKPGRRSHSRPS